MVSTSILCLFVSIGSILATPTPLPTSNSTTCSDVLQSVGVSRNFEASIAHAVHSMTVEVLRKFDPSATENNFIPTIPLDLRSEQAILPYAQDLKSKDSGMFLTEGMKVLDQVLSHMNEPHWDMNGYTPLELVVHAFHMREMWTRVQLELEKLGKSSPAPSEDFCQCAMDLENNGIMKMLRYIAMAVREPSLVYGDRSFSDRSYNGPVKPYGNVYQYHFNGNDVLKKDEVKSEDVKPVQKYGNVYQYHFKKDDILKKADQPKPEEVNNDAAKRYGNVYQYHFNKDDVMKKDDQTTEKDVLLRETSEAMPPLTDAKAWNFWKMNSPPEHHRDVALFLYCAIQKAHTAQ